MERVPEPGELASRLLDAFDRRANKEILVTINRGRVARRFTGLALGDEVDARGRQLANLGLPALVLIHPPGAEFISIFLACLIQGITVVPASPPRRGSASERLAHIARDCGAAAILCPPGSQANVRAALGECATPVISLPDDPYALLPVELQNPTQPASNCCTKAAVIQYTSGSTQLPKGVLISGRNILANCDLVARSWQMDERCRFVNWMPYFHDMGLMGGLLYPLLCGGFSVQMSPYEFVREPCSWLRVISDWKATFSGGPAFAFSELLRRVPPSDLTGVDLSHWEYAFCGAEPVPPGLLDKVAAHLAISGLRRKSVFSCYGMAEMTLFAAGLPEADDAIPDLPFVSHGCRMNAELRECVRIVHPETKAALPDGDEGEIWLAGPSTGSGYLNRPDETADAFGQSLVGTTESFFRTGDLGRMVGERLFISGRIKDVLITNGQKISAVEVENLACRTDPHLNPLAAAAFMEDECASGRAVLIMETLSCEDSAIDFDRARRSIQRLVLGEWGLHLVDVLFVPRGHLPRTTSGKIRRRQVAQDYRNGKYGAIAI